MKTSVQVCSVVRQAAEFVAPPCRTLRWAGTKGKTAALQRLENDRDQLVRLGAVARPGDFGFPGGAAQLPRLSPTTVESPVDS